MCVCVHVCVYVMGSLFCLVNPLLSPVLLILKAPTCCCVRSAHSLGTWLQSSMQMSGNAFALWPVKLSKQSDTHRVFSRCYVQGRRTIHQMFYLA